MPTSKASGLNYLAASVGYVIGKTVGDRIQQKQNPKPTETPIDRARRLMNNK